MEKEILGALFGLNRLRSNGFIGEAKWADLRGLIGLGLKQIFFNLQCF